MQQADFEAGNHIKAWTSERPGSMLQIVALGSNVEPISSWGMHDAVANRFREPRHDVDVAAGGRRYRARLCTRL